MEVCVSLEGVDYAAEGVQADAEHLMKVLGLGDAELSIVLCNDAFIRPLNRDWRGVDRPTDVMAFAMREGEGADPQDPVLGDIVISVETAARQAAEMGHSLEREVRILLIHGLLHLLGYDHEEESEAEKMEEEERRLLALLGSMTPS